MPKLRLPLKAALIVAGTPMLLTLAIGGLFATEPPLEKVPSPVRGRQLFVQSCAHCHGDDARGSGEDSDGPDLHDLAIGNARISALIRTGVPDEMPSFAKKHGPVDISDLTAYLRTLR